MTRLCKPKTVYTTIEQARHRHCPQTTFQLNDQLHTQPTWLFWYQAVQSSRPCTKVIAPGSTAVQFMLAFAKIQSRELMHRLYNEHKLIYRCHLKSKWNAIVMMKMHRQAKQVWIELIMRHPKSGQTDYEIVLFLYSICVHVVEQYL